MDDNNNPFMISGVEFPDIPKLRKQGDIKLSTKTPLPMAFRPYVSPITSAVAAIVLSRRVLARALSLRTYLYNTVSKDYVIDVSMMEDPSLVRDILSSMGLPTDAIVFDTIMSIIKSNRDYARRMYDLRTPEDIDKDLAAIEEGTGIVPPSAQDYLLHAIVRYVWNPSHGDNVRMGTDDKKMLYLMAAHDIVNNVGLVTDDIIETYDIYRKISEEEFGINLPKTETLVDLMITSPAAAMELINTSNAIETAHGSQIDGRAFWDVHHGAVRSYEADNELLFLERARINPAGPEMKSIVNMTGSHKDASRWLVNRVDEIKATIGTRLDFNKIVHQDVSKLKGYSRWLTSIYNGTFLSLNDVLGVSWEVNLRAVFEK